jgi:F1F0 ATPase subunit 2
MSDLVPAFGSPPNLPVLLWAALLGVGLGAMFFGGLWWTARRGAASPRPALWFFVSLLLRMALAMAGFYLVAGGRWERMLACLLGFIVARIVVTWTTRPPLTHPVNANREPEHAP